MQTTDRARQLGERPVGRLMLHFSIPAISGMLVNALYNVVDRIFIGQGVGSLALAGATVGFPLMLVSMAFAMFVGIGATALISISLGEGKKEYAEAVLGNAFTMLVVTSLSLLVLGLIFLDPLLRLFGASDTIIPFARRYMGTILLGTPFMALGFGMNHMIRGEGNPRMAMTTMFIGAGLNIVLDPLFIFTFGMGVRGAAIATVISQAVSAIWVLSYFIRRGKSHLTFHRANLRIDGAVAGRILALGSAPFAMQLAASVMNAILNNQLQRYGGDIAISVMGIIYSVAMFLLMPLFGLNQGTQPIIGFNYGARKYDRVRKALTLAAVAATVHVMLGYAAISFFPGFFIRLFNADDPQLIALGTRAIRIFFFMLPVIGFQIVSANYFQATGKPRHAMFLSLSRQVLFLIPLLLILPVFAGLDGIFLAAPIADFSSALVTGVFLFRELRHLGRSHADSTAAAEKLQPGLQDE